MQCALWSTVGVRLLDSAWAFAIKHKPEKPKAVVVRHRLISQHSMVYGAHSVAQHQQLNARRDKSHKYLNFSPVVFFFSVLFCGCVCVLYVLSKQFLWLSRRGTTFCILFLFHRKQSCYSLYILLLLFYFSLSFSHYNDECIWNVCFFYPMNVAAHSSGFPFDHEIYLYGHVEQKSFAELWGK